MGCTNRTSDVTVISAAEAAPMSASAPLVPAGYDVTPATSGERFSTQDPWRIPLSIRAPS